MFLRTTQGNRDCRVGRWSTYFRMTHNRESESLRAQSVKLPEFERNTDQNPKENTLLLPAARITVVLAVRVSDFQANQEGRRVGYTAPHTMEAFVDPVTPATLCG